MSNLDIGTLLQLGPLAVVLLYIVMRLERAMGGIALGLGQITQVMLLLLRRAGVSEEEALSLCGGVGPAGPRSWPWEVH